jgi:hypothetical protein
VKIHCVAFNAMVCGPSDLLVPFAVIPANAGIQRRSSKDAGFRVPLRGPDATTHQILLLDEEQGFVFRGRCQSRQGLKQAKDFGPVAQVAARQFADHEVVDADGFVLEQADKSWITVAQVVDPDRCIDQYHRLPSRRRATLSSFGSVAPKRARRRALSRWIRALNASLSRALRSWTPESICARLRRVSSSVTVVRMVVTPEDQALIIASFDAIIDAPVRSA